MKSKVRQATMDTMVKILDFAPLEAKLSESFGTPVELRMIGKAYIPDVNFVDKSGETLHSFIIDKEFCIKASTLENFFISDLHKSVFVLKQFKDIEVYKKHTDGTMKVMFPSFLVTIDEDDIKACMTGEEMSLFEYTKSRYGYNDRIESNEMNALKKIYHDDKKLLKTVWTNVVELEWER